MWLWRWVDVSVNVEGLTSVCRSGAGEVGEGDGWDRGVVMGRDLFVSVEAVSFEGE